MASKASIRRERWAVRVDEIYVELLVDPHSKQAYVVFGTISAENGDPLEVLIGAEEGDEVCVALTRGEGKPRL